MTVEVFPADEPQELPTAEVLDAEVKPEESQNVQDEDQEVLKYTQGLRRQFVNSLINKDGKVSDDKVDRSFFLQALGDMDRAALGNMRIKADKKAGDAGVQAAAMIAKLLKDPVLAAARRAIAPIEREIPVLPEEFPDPDVVPGEAQFHADVLDSQDFFPTEKEASETRPAIADED